MLDEVQAAVPEPRLVDVFRLKYDYHNAKALVKGEATGADVRRLLVSGGRYSCRQLLEGFQKDALSGVSARFQQAVAAARRILADTRDPQQCDILLDKACYEEMARLAEDCASPFLKGYVRLCADTANLRTAVRVARMGKGSDFLLHVLLPGGSVAESALAAARPEDLGSLFQAGALEKAARLGARAAQPDGGPLLAFERECDNALTRYVAAGKARALWRRAGYCLSACQGRRAHGRAHHSFRPPRRAGRGHDLGAAAGMLCVRKGG